MEEKPKLNFIPKTSPKLNITEKVVPKGYSAYSLNIREIFPSKIKEMIGKHGFGTMKVDPHFGQNWNLANLTTEDVYYFGNQFYKDRNEKDVSDKIDIFYQTLLRMNPELKNITVGNKERLLDVIRGVGSGLHFNDIKYFVENLKGDANNESEPARSLEEKAIGEYLKRNGVDIEKDESQVTEDDLKKIDELYEKIGFAFSPETMNRIINDNPYQ